MRRLAIGIDLGGTQVRAALVDERGRVLERTAVPTASSAGPSVVLDQMVRVGLAVAAGVDRAVLVGVGVSAPGPLDAERGIALSVPTLAGFVDLPLAHLLSDRLGLPVTLENDGIAACLGEWRFGAGRGLSHFVYVTVSTGIGGGVVADGRLLRGRRGMAAHVGHMTIVRDGDRCSCGNLGCWEAYASGTALARRARHRAAAVPRSALAPLADALDAATIFAAAEAGDALARDLVAEESDLLGTGIVNLLHLYSPQRVVVGGGVAASFPALLPGIRARIDACAMAPFKDTLVVQAALGGNSGLVGAAALAFGTAGPLKLGTNADAPL